MAPVFILDLNDNQEVNSCRQTKSSRLWRLALTFGVLSIPGFGAFVNAAGGQAEVVAAVVAVYAVVIGVVHYAYGKVGTDDGIGVSAGW